MGELFFLRRYLTTGLDAVEKAALGLCLSLFTWFLVLGCLGFFSKHLNRESRLVRYLSESSYWLYFVHILLVGILQILFLKWMMPAGAKFILTASAASGLSLLSYEKIARRGSTPLRPAAKIGVTGLLVLLILSAGTAYQYAYNNEKSRYEKIITGFYRKYLNREPDKIGLDHWVMMALNKWGLEKVEREGFIEAWRKGAR